LTAGITVLAILSFCAAGTVKAEILNSCSTYCHGMPPRDGARKANLHFNSRSSAFPGNHQAHLKAAPSAADCSVCHAPVAPTNFGHQNGVIVMANSLNGYSSATLRAKYNKGVFINQTSIPNLTNATCSNVNCHFENTTPAWGSAAFASPGNCNACHGAPPADGNHPATTGPGKKHGDYYGTTTGSCIKCHNDHTVEAKPFAHATSAGKRSLVLQFTAAPNSGGTYSKTADLAYPTYLPSRTSAANRNGTCSSMYCHSNGNGGLPTTTPTWGSTLATDCSGCHGGAAGSASVIATGKHGAHVNNATVLGTNLGCVDCHAKTVSGNTTITTVARHVNGLKDYSGARAGGSARYNTTTKACTNNYCHSNGNPGAIAYVNMSGSKTWTGTASLGCNGCHGRTGTTGAPDYANGGTTSTSANSHAKHVASVADCEKCHTSTTTSGSAINTGSALHLNGVIDVTFDAAKAGATATWTQSSGACGNVTCHGGTGSTVSWGGASLNCQDCHGNGASASVADFAASFWNNGTISKFQLTGTGSWAVTGHGRPAASGNYAGSANPPANFAGITNYCEWCHDSTVGHYTAGNPFRLRGWADATWGKNGACMICHATGSAGVTVGGQARNASAASKVGSYHYGAKHSTALSGGQFCWDCHDPHGTGTTNQFMIRPKAAVVSDATTGAPTTQSATSVVFTLSATPTGTDYAKSAAPFNGICNVCHTTTSHYTTTAGDSHNSTTRCTSCHPHSGSSATTGFTPTGGGDCTSCHASQQGTGTRRVVGTDTVLPSHHIQATTINAASCSVCHEQSVFGHQVAGDVAVGMFNQDTGAALTYDGTTATAANLENSCNSCHDANGASRLGANALKPFADSGDTTRPQFIDWSTSKQAHGANMACFNCHGNSAGVAGNTLTPKYNAHGSATAKMLQYAYNANDTMTTTANICYNCHGTTIANGVTSPSILAAVNLSATIGHKAEKCSDCHDPHSAKPGVHTIGPNSAMAPVLNGVPGKGGWPATSPTMATTWTGTGTLAVTYTAKPAATKEYEICFRCHAGSVPAPTGYTAGALRMTDLGLEFNPNNKSGHPIVASLNNYGGSIAPKALLATDMVAPWTAIGTQTMTCSDCHGATGTGAKGPHGSSVRWMLTGTNQAWPFTTTAGNGTASGTPWLLGTYNTGTAPNTLFCRNCHVISGTNGVHKAVATSGEHTSWKSTARAACISCHIRIPHGAKTGRMLRLGTAAVLGRYAPNGNGGEVGTSTQQVLSKYTKGTQTSSRRGSFSGVGCSEHSGGTDTW